MKVMLVTTPVGDTASTFPPIGALSVLNYARKRSDHEFVFFNIDYFRPRYAEALQRIVDQAPDVLGISSVVSTAYRYTQRLASDVKRLLPSTLIVMGGNLCASSELLLVRAAADICVNGEGEVPFLNVLRRAQTTRKAAEFADIPGLMLLNERGELVNTGYEAPLPAVEVWDVDWADLQTDGSFDYYFPRYNQPQAYKRRYAAAHPNHTLHSGNENARSGSLLVAKGCVARCTFCHRWDKGIRHVPVDEIMRRFRHLYEVYGVRQFSMIAETFGTDKRWLKELLDSIEPYRILWNAGGVRTSAVTPELIERMKQTGCTSLIFGNETGSARMLELMEKKVSLQDNYNAAQWTVEANLGNIIQLVIGMPGESPETIRETIEYCKFGTSISVEQNPRQISINYAQALPGTPLYEYARIHGLLGGTDQDSEEAYLLAISDRAAADPETFINFTECKRLTVLSWNLLIRIEVTANYVTKFGMRNYVEWLRSECPSGSKAHAFALRHVERTGDPGVLFFCYLAAKLKTSELLAWYPMLFFRIRRLAPMLTLMQTVMRYGPMEGWRLVLDLIAKSNNKISVVPSVSLRKIVIKDKKEMNIDDGVAMAPLRAGR